MVNLRRWKEEIIMKAGGLLAACGLLAASLAANGACMFPFFEPEQLEELEKMKKCNEKEDDLRNLKKDLLLLDVVLLY